MSPKTLARPGAFTQLMETPGPDADPAGKPFQHLQYCVRCCIPQTQEGVIFDELGVSYDDLGFFHIGVKLADVDDAVVAGKALWVTGRLGVHVGNHPVLHAP